jgi:hypothetical protein
MSTSPPTAVQKRATHPQFIDTFALQALRPRLPLRFPVPDDTPPSLKRRYRSWYRYLGPGNLATLKKVRQLSHFEMALRLIDFSPLRHFLAQHYYQGSTRGQVPFDPVSLFLAICLRRELGNSWRALSTLLAGEHGPQWRRLLGFSAGHTPSASGLRYFFHTLGPEIFAELCPLFIQLLHQHGLLPSRSTFPSDPPTRGLTISHDIMLHEARSRMRCAHVTTTCYQPLPRPCPARAAGRRGCDCSETACALHCRLATPLDQQARYIHYQGRNKDADLPHPSAAQGRDVYGYASNPDRLLDDRFACAWTLRSDLHPANADERRLFPNSFPLLRQRFPALTIGEVLADAALGYQDCLDLIWNAGALRMVDIRAHSTDLDPQKRLQRGYDQNGRPLCVHGYPMSANGHDYQRRRTKWICAHACTRDPSRPAPHCPFSLSKHGQIVNVGRTLPDLSTRLAREVPYGSSSWTKRYARRNLSESRNSSLEALGLKRLPAFGLAANYREVVVADFLCDLRTLGRLVKEATILALRAGPTPA